ncbi:DUF6588 family protein [Winogradskyella sp. 3972H.M.0a.05]|uniref:DUF6588 family protein n=1 Tax=Winogradskyella sp. 3972H.M.0a.05 TaxID=2950277 RepID=UPI0033925515
MKKLLLILLLGLVGRQSFSQELETIILAADDASKLTENYINPVMNGLMYSMNGGWYTTAKTHKKFGFDITINANASFVPSKDELFAFVPSDYSFISLPNGETQLPTVMSDQDTATDVEVRIPNGDGTFNVATFEMPGGITDDLPINAVPTPMVQAGLGLPFKTDVKLRFVPKISFDDNVDAGLVGLGLQHDIMQYLGPLDKLPLNISVLAAFTTMNVTYQIEDEDALDNVAVTNGEVEFKMNTWTLQALASLDFKIITLYGGFGYNSGNSTIKMKGTYNLTYDLEDSNGNVIGSASDSITNPINLDFDASGARATLGARLNIGFFKIFADYTLQEYNTATAGIAFSFR